MKIKIGILLLIFAIVKISNAQLIKNTWVLGGNLNANYGFGTPMYDIFDHTRVFLTPSVGYFVLDKFVIGSSFNILYTNLYLYKNYGSSELFGGGSTEFYTINPYIRYYLLNVDKTLNFLLEFSYKYGHSKETFIDVSMNQYNFSTGFEYFFNSTIGLEFIINYAYSKRKILTEDKSFTTILSSTLESEKRNDLNFNIGFKIHLIKN
ncbi:MAG: hypothetical protein QM539_05730 [Alphaproteobacteria bacterium]|nr:hypothetical protein [Alphaproteobacteria bacterium]